MAKKQSSAKSGSQKHVDGSKAVRRTFEERVEYFALMAALVVSLLQAGIMLLWGPVTEVLPMVGSPDSVAVRGLLTSVLIAIVLGPYAYVRGTQARNNLLPAQYRQAYGLSAIPLTIAMALVTALFVSWGFDLLNRAFQGMEFNRVSTAILLGIIAGVVAYTVSRTMAHLNASGMIYLVVAGLFGTLLMAGARNDDPYWWEYSFSHLGMTASDSKAIFNIGLVFTGTLMVIWTEFFMKRYKILEDNGLITPRVFTILRASLIVSAVLLAFVGIFRFGISPFFNVVHDLSAGGMGVLLGLLMLGMIKLNPHYLRPFYYISWAILGAMIFSAVVKVMGFINLTGLEMAAFTLASLWLVLFLKNTDLLVDKVAPEYDL